VKRCPWPEGAVAAGSARPAKPSTVYAEDFSLLLRIRRLRIKRGVVRVLS
jgi:hypothetical protein